MGKKVTKKKTGVSRNAGKKASVKITSPKAQKTIKKAANSAKKSTSQKPLAAQNTLSAQQTPPPKPPLKLKTYLKKAELEHFKILLVEKLREITGNVNHIEKEFLQKSRQDATGDLSSMPIHMADIGSDNYEQEFTLGLMATEQKIVQEILLALRRIEDGSYGMCEGTGEPIPKARLEAFPWARYCVSYAEMIEKGQVAEVSGNDYSDRVYASSAIGANEDDQADEDDRTDEEDGDDDDYEVGFDDEDDDEDEDEDEPYYN